MVYFVYFHDDWKWVKTGLEGALNSLEEQCDVAPHLSSTRIFVVKTKSSPCAVLAGRAVPMYDARIPCELGQQSCADMCVLFLFSCTVRCGRWFKKVLT